jgi:hypothetical protein
MGVKMGRNNLNKMKGKWGCKGSLKASPKVCFGDNLMNSRKQRWVSLKDPGKISCYCGKMRRRIDYLVSRIKEGSAWQVSGESTKEPVGVLREDWNLGLIQKGGCKCLNPAQILLP